MTGREAVDVKWAESLRHHAAHPDPISMHCAIPARIIEQAAEYIAALEAQLAAAPRVTVTDEVHIVNKLGTTVERLCGAAVQQAVYHVGLKNTLFPSYAPHRVARVALVDEPTQEGEG